MTAWKTALNIHGWAVVEGVLSEQDVIEVAGQLGRVIPAPTGELVKVLRPKASCDAPRGSLSGHHGLGSFPLHTDTAFWTLPARYLVMTARGDLRRRTPFIPMEAVRSLLSANDRSHVDRSVWRIQRSGGKAYCSASFVEQGLRGWRYDPILMRPANGDGSRAAAALAEVLGEQAPRISVPWSKGRCLLLDNWRVLHARETEPVAEGPRELLRAYVR